MTRYFLYRPNLNITINQINDCIRYEYDDFYVHCIPLHDYNSAINHICYICETKQQRGKFDIAKAKELGVPVGPLYALLKNGRDVTLSCGKVVRSQDVVGPSHKGRCVAIICDISGENEAILMQELILHPAWSR
jgi:ribonuclease Z